jgi:hypothetical protein
MEEEFFNLDRLRKNWLEGSRDSAHLEHEKFKNVMARLDPLRDGHRLLAEIEEQCRVCFPEHSEALLVFVEEARLHLLAAFPPESSAADDQELDQEDSHKLSAPAPQDDDDSDDESEEDVDEDEDDDDDEELPPLEEFTAVLYQLEDLLEAIM